MHHCAHARAKVSCVLGHQRALGRANVSSHSLCLFGSSQWGVFGLGHGQRCGSALRRSRPVLWPSFSLPFIALPPRSKKRVVGLPYRQSGGCAKKEGRTSPLGQSQGKKHRTKNCPQKAKARGVFVRSLASPVGNPVSGPPCLQNKKCASLVSRCECFREREGVQQRRSLAKGLDPSVQT